MLAVSAIAGPELLQGSDHPARGLQISSEQGMAATGLCIASALVMFPPHIFLWTRHCARQVPGIPKIRCSCRVHALDHFEGAAKHE